MEKTYDTSFELRSEEVQDILSKVPHWMIRWGTMLLFGIVLMLFVVSWFLKYPDIIKTEVVLTTHIPPEKLLAKSSGRIEAILVQDKASVLAHTPLAIIENASSYKDVFRLKNALEHYQKNGFQQFDFKTFAGAQLGEIEGVFATFQKDFMAQELNQQLTPYKVENQAERSENTQIKERLALLIQQKTITEQELQLQRNELARYTKLHGKGIISEQEFEAKKMNFLQAEKNYKNLLSSISQLQSSLISNSRAIKGTEINDKKNEVDLDRSLLQSFYQLKKVIKDWELTYVLQAKVTGVVTFSKYWVANQTVNPGDEIFSVVPTNRSGFIGKVKAPALNSGKLKVGQKVNIRLSNFPDREFGMLTGNVSNIALVPDKDGNLAIDVALPKGMLTSYKKTIPFQQEMRGSAEIITEDLRLFERIFYQFREMTKVE